jgi:hypothetical protein
MDAGLANSNRAVLAVNLEQKPLTPEDSLDLLDFCGIQKALRSIRAVQISDAETLRRAGFDGNRQSAPDCKLAPVGRPYLGASRCIWLQPGAIKALTVI